MKIAAADMSPALKRTIWITTLIEALILGVGIGGYLLTDNIYFIVASVAAAAPFVAITLLRAMAREKAGKNAPGAGSIVE